MYCNKQGSVVKLLHGNIAVDNYYCTPQQWLPSKMNHQEWRMRIPRNLWLESYKSGKKAVPKKNSWTRSKKTLTESSRNVKPLTWSGQSQPDAILTHAAASKSEVNGLAPMIPCFAAKDIMKLLNCCIVKITTGMKINDSSRSCLEQKHLPGILTNKKWPRQAHFCQLHLRRQDKQSQLIPRLQQTCSTWKLTTSWKNLIGRWIQTIWNPQLLLTRTRSTLTEPLEFLMLCILS